MNCSIEASTEQIKPVVTMKYDFECRDKPILMTVFNISDCRYFDARIKIHDFHIEGSYERVKFFIETSMTKTKSVVMEKHDFENRN